MAKHRLLADSRGLGWHDAYTSLATEAPWRRTLHLTVTFKRIVGDTPGAYRRSIASRPV